MNNCIAESLKSHYQSSFAMLTEIIDSCPEDLWSQSVRGHSPIWQNICHALAGSWVWFRPAGQPFQEPPMGEEVAELKIIPDYTMSKEDVLEFAKEAQSRAEAFIALNQDALTAPFSFYPKLNNLDIIIDQIRHIQHHVGYCNSIMGEKGAAVSWK